MGGYYLGRYQWPQTQQEMMLGMPMLMKASLKKQLTQRSMSSIRGGGEDGVEEIDGQDVEYQDFVLDIFRR
jgi:hypothetical protein